MIDNSERAIEIRRNQNALTVFGTGILAFAVWDFVKALGVVFSRKSEVTGYLLPDGAELGLSENTLFFIVLGVVTVVLLIDFLVRVYIAKSALAESRGKRRSSLYLVLSAIMIMAAVYNILMFAIGGNTEAAGIAESDRTVASALIELTQAVLLTEMIAASVKLRRLKARGKHSKR